MPDNTSGAWDQTVAPWHLDEHIPDFPVPVGPAATIGLPLPDGAVPSRATVLCRAVADTVAEAARPLLLSGDCLAGLAVAAGLQRQHRDIAVVWLDAHGDFNTPAITISGYLGGMAVAMLAGRAPELFADPLGLRPVPEHNIVLAHAPDPHPPPPHPPTARPAPPRPAPHPPPPGGRYAAGAPGARRPAGLPARRRRHHGQHRGARAAIPRGPRSHGRRRRELPDRDHRQRGRRRGLPRL